MVMGVVARTLSAYPLSKAFLLCEYVITFAWLVWCIAWVTMSEVVAVSVIHGV